MIEIKQIITNPDKTYNLEITKENRTIRLHSSRPIAEAEKLFRNLPQNPPIYFLGGLGLGYLLEEILQKTTSYCLIYEPQTKIFDEVLRLRPELTALLYQNPRVFLVQNPDSLKETLHNQQVKDIAFAIHRPYGELFSEEMLQAKEIIASHIRRKEVSNSTLIRFGKIWAKNIFRNMHRYFTSQRLISYKNTNRNKPAVIIGAGSSLEQALPYLKENQDKAILIACDTVLPMLCGTGINPDFVITVDPQEKNAYYLRYSSNKNHKLIADPGVHDSTFEGYKHNNIILMDSLFPFYPYFEEFWGSYGLLASGGSVSTSAFDFARIIGSDPILLVGQDLSFTNKKTHSHGNILAEFSRTTHTRLNSYHTLQAQTTYISHAKPIKGRRPNSTVSADARFIIFRDWFAEEIPKTNVRVIVAGMDGAYLEGAEHLEIENAFQTLNHLPTIQKDSQKADMPINSTLYQEQLQELSTTLEKLTMLSKHNLLMVKKARAGKNLQQALNETTHLQKILNETGSTNQKISHMIAVSIQEAIQQTLEIPEQISEIEQLLQLEKISSEILSGLKELKNHISKAQKFIR